MQDEITLTRTLSLTLGAKFEHNAYTGFENEPSAQLVWAPNARHTVWASAAKAIRQPSTIDSGLRGGQRDRAASARGASGWSRFSEIPTRKSKQLRDFETGYRAQINRRLSLDVTGFLSFYQNLETSRAADALLCAHRRGLLTW